MTEAENKAWDEIEQKQKFRCRRTWFYIGLTNYGMSFSIILFGKTVFQRETNWREKIRAKTTTC